MEIAIKALQLILSLSILVILHELGHFIPAKLFKTKVEKFYLFFDPWFSLFKFKKKDTEYGIGWIPLGGYVKISGMVDESMDTEQMKQPPQPWEFRSKPTWQRLIIMIGGVSMNVILAVCIYSMILFMWGERYLPVENMNDGIWCADSIAFDIGLQNGDKIVSIDNKNVSAFHKIVPDIIIEQAKQIKVNRNGELITLNVPDDFIQKVLKKKTTLLLPRIPFEIAGFSDNSIAKKAGIKERDRIIGINDISIKYFDEFKTNIAKHLNDSVTLNIQRGKEVVAVRLLVPQEGIIGVMPRAYGYDELEKEGIYVFNTTHYNILQSVPAGIAKAEDTFESYIKQFKIIFSSKTEGYKHIGGFLSLGSVFSPVWDWQQFWGLTAFLSIMLAVINILPIPALDGGHVLFLLYEMIFRRKPSDKFMEYAQITGMVILLGLMLFANGNDVLKLFTK